MREDTLYYCVKTWVLFTSDKVSALFLIDWLCWSCRSVCPVALSPQLHTRIQEAVATSKSDPLGWHLGICALSRRLWLFWVARVNCSPCGWGSLVRDWQHSTKCPWKCHFFVPVASATSTETCTFSYLSLCKYAKKFLYKWLLCKYYMKDVNPAVKF